MKNTTLAILMILFFPVIALAQPNPADPSTTAFTWYTSVAGVVAATMLGVSILKRALGEVSGLNSIPTWVYAVVISAILTFLTVKVWGTLPGQLWQTMTQSVIMAGAASGFYEWINKSGSTSLATSARKARGAKVRKFDPPALG